MDVIYNAIDVSKHQGKINWEAVKNAGVTHAMLRAGYGRYKNQVDPQFERNSAECERLGIQYGVPFPVSLPGWVPYTRHSRTNCSS